MSNGAGHAPSKLKIFTFPVLDYNDEYVLPDRWRPVSASFEPTLADGSGRITVIATKLKVRRDD